MAGFAGGQASGPRFSTSQAAVLTVAGNTTVKGQITIPDGSWLRSVTLDTPVAITGTPTSCLFRAGTTDGGVDIVAAVDAKAQGHISTTIVAAFDKVLGLVGFTTIFFQLITSGGTSSAGPVNVLCSYDPAPH